MKIGDIIPSTVMRIEPYGIWLETSGRRGLLLITDVADNPVDDLHDYAKIGDVFTVKIIRFNAQNGDFVASLKEVEG